MKINLENIKSDLRFTINLQHEASPAGTYVNPGAKIDDILLSVDGIDDDEPNLTTVTGTTDSKLYAVISTIKNLTVKDKIVNKKVGDKFGGSVDVIDFDPKRFLDKPIKIAGTDIVATILMYEDERKEYLFYSDTDTPIKYIDFPDGTTTFIFNKPIEGNNSTTPLLNKFSGLVEEPKIDSSVFISRGIVNVFEPFIKLKKVKSLNEMTKFGFGYYKINKQGFNF